MKIFTENEAKYFCEHFHNTQGDSEKSLKDFSKAHFKGKTLLKEGSPKFSEFQDCLKRDIERNLFVAAANYKAAHSMMIYGTSSWAYVTLYYSSFYAASALLGMFGVWIDWPNTVEVKIGNIGQQELEYKKKPTSVTTYTGSHRIFWDLFYSSVSSLSPYIVDARLKTAIEPISDNPIWLIENRNIVNYDSYKSYDLICSFKDTFKAKQFPNSLPGALNTQYKVTEALNKLAFKYASDFSLSTDALNRLPPKAGTRVNRIDKSLFRSRVRIAAITPAQKGIFGI